MYYAMTPEQIAEQARQPRFATPGRINLFGGQRRDLAPECRIRKGYGFLQIKVGHTYLGICWR